MINRLLKTGFTPGCLGLILTILILGSCTPVFSPNFELISVHAVKGRIFSDESEGGIRRGGFSLLSSRVNEFRGISDFPIVIADNNSIHGTPAAYFSRGEHIVNLFNAIGLDLMIVDSREFYYGSGRLAELADMANFPMVSANIRRAADGEPPEYLVPYYYVESANLLIIGLSSPNLIQRNLPANVAGLSLIGSGAAVRDALSRFTRERQRSVDPGLEAPVERPFIVVHAVSHKLSSDAPDEFLAELASIPAIDLLVMGERDLPVDGMAPVLSDGVLSRGKTGADDAAPDDPWSAYDRWRGRLVLVDDERSDNGAMVDRIQISNVKLREYREYPLDSVSTDPDESISELIFSIRREAETQLNRIISDSSIDMEHRFSGESSVANLVTDAMREYTGSDVFLINSGSVRGRISRGAFTLNDAYRLLPFESGLLTLEISGAELLTVLQRSAFRYRDPEEEKGFLQGSGLEMSLRYRDGSYEPDPASIRIAGEPLELQRRYILGLTTFLHQGGDGYDLFLSLPVRQEFPDSLLSAFIDYALAQRDLARDIEGRIEALPE
jgi:5'-nucleotidase/UDP-sugar diphosphatase